MSKSLFSHSNVNSRPHKSVFLKILNVSSDNFNDELADINMLINSKVSKLIYSYINDYIEDRFEYLIEKFTFDHFEDISVSLYNLRKPNKKMYETIRKNTANVIKVIYQSVDLYKNYLGIRAGFIEAKERLKILDDIKQLKIYLKSLISSSSFADVTVSAKPLFISPEIVKYFNLYGVPCNGIFDPEKLARIIEELETESDKEC